MAAVVADGDDGACLDPEEVVAAGVHDGEVVNGADDGAVDADRDATLESLSELPSELERVQDYDAHGAPLLAEATALVREDREEQPEERVVVPLQPQELAVALLGVHLVCLPALSYPSVAIWAL